MDDHCKTSQNSAEGVGGGGMTLASSSWTSVGTQKVGALGDV